ncbi:MAG: hypothetical protein CR986_06250 [Ignavibacteriae bacterium]|nr:MAG: hypothetical protein CR986_06250 [Ignavibacteriota bacterium]
MKKIIIICLAFILSMQLSAQSDEFTRFATIKTDSFEVGGFGGIVSGVDFDNDGKPDLYACNTNMVDREDELKPRLYKFEWTNGKWDSVWSADISGIVPAQNTWPALTWGDLDKDGKQEIIWGPVNALDAETNPNPPRIIVFETPGDGSDNMGVSDGFGGFLPNAKTTIIDADSVNFELRPVIFRVADVDNDNTDEIIFAERRGSKNNFHFGVVSVNDIPDGGGDSETWTIELSGLGDTNFIGNNYDAAVLDNYVYVWNDEGHINTLRYVNNSWESLPPQSIGSGSFKGSQVVDVDGDGTKEIVVGSWFGSGNGSVLLLQQDGDTLVYSKIADVSKLGGGRIVSSAFGDLDNDDQVDFVFGSRFDASYKPINAIYRVEYQGGDIADSNNYTLSVIDSNFFFDNPLTVADTSGGGDIGTLIMVDNDGDGYDEVIYTQDYTRGSANDWPLDVIFLENSVAVSVEEVEGIIPNKFTVSQNYPNPFNPSTTIQFGITKPANVEIKVFDILGREVSTLVSNKLFSAGTYNVNFDANKLASGIYVYRVTAGNAVITKKMQLLK